MKSDDKTAGSEGAQSIQRALRVLKFLSANMAAPPTAAEVAQQCELTKPTAHRILGALAAEGFAAFDEGTHGYTLGLESYSLGISASQRFDLAFFAAAPLRRIAKASRDTCFLTVRSGDEALCIGREIGDFPVKILTLDVGHRRPLGVGAGSLALLAFMPVDECEIVLAHHDKALASYPEFSVGMLREQVEESRRLGYAYNAGRLLPEMSAIGVPILTRSGALIGSLSVAALTSRLSGKHRDRILEMLRHEADTVSQAVSVGSPVADIATAPSRSATTFSIDQEDACRMNT